MREMQIIDDGEPMPKPRGEAHKVLRALMARMKVGQKIPVYTSTARELATMRAASYVIMREILVATGQPYRVTWRKGVIWRIE